MIRRFSQWFALLLACGVLAGVFLFNHVQIQAQANRPVPKKQEEKQRPEVAVIEVKTQAYTAQASGHGAATAHFATTLTGRVNGQVISLNPDFEPGLRIKKGKVLAQLDDAEYRAALATAKNTLATAKVSLLEEQRQGRQALAEWKSSGMKGAPDSDLVLRKPQLAAAKAAVAEAEAALSNAEKDLANTRILAPFDALIVSRDISPGSYIQAGTEIASLYSTDRLEISVALSEQEWASLPQQSILTRGDWPATITSVSGTQQWQGTVIRSEQHLDSTTRQRALFIAVPHPLDQTAPLLPGTFVQVTINGTSTDGLWQLPSSSLSQRGEIWYVKQDGTLDCFSTEPLFSRDEMIYIKAPETVRQGSHAVLVHPLSSYLKGMLVNPVAESMKEALQ